MGQFLNGFERERPSSLILGGKDQALEFLERETKTLEFLE